LSCLGTTTWLHGTRVAQEKACHPPQTKHDVKKVTVKKKAAESVSTSHLRMLM
jgi:hypothetical protein